MLSFRQKISLYFSSSSHLTLKSHVSDCDRIRKASMAEPTAEDHEGAKALVAMLQRHVDADFQSEPFPTIISCNIWYTFPRTNPDVGLREVPGKASTYAKATSFCTIVIMV